MVKSARTFFLTTNRDALLHALRLLIGRQQVLVGNHLEFLEALAYPLVHLQELLHAVHRAFVFRVLHGARCEVKHAVGEASLRELVVAQEEILKLK